jgi:rubredoxin
MPREMKVGESFPPRRIRDRPCPKCGDKVFKMYPTGFVIESAQVIGKTDNGFQVRNNWHCPACGLWKDEVIEVNEQGIRMPRRVDSSDKSKSKRSKRT